MIVACVVLVPLVPARLGVVAALALGTTIGQTVVAIPLHSPPKICGPAAVQVPGTRPWAQAQPRALQDCGGRGRRLAVPLHHKLVAAALTGPRGRSGAIIAFGVVAASSMATTEAVLAGCGVQSGCGCNGPGALARRLAVFRGSPGEYVEPGGLC